MLNVKNKKYFENILNKKKYTCLYYYNKFTYSDNKKDGQKHFSQT